MKAKCRGCGQEIVWAVTETERKMPVEVRGYTLFTLEEELDGTMRAKAVQVHASHFSVCPAADQFRKPVR